MSVTQTNRIYPDELVALIHHLKEQELAEELITSISDELFVHMKKNEDVFHIEVQINIDERLLKSSVRGSCHLAVFRITKKYINVLGPTGVGKTTTIAKMAARAVLEKKKKIGFITTDTYRIAAIEQLKTYAGLLQAPIEIVYNEQDLQEAMQKFEAFRCCIYRYSRKKL